MLERPLVRAGIAAVLLAALAGAFLAADAARGGDGSDAPTLEGAPSPAATEPSDEGLGPLDGQAPLRGEPAPDFVLRDSSGGTVRLSELRGQVVWINFWATWCSPCKKELPIMQRLQEEHGDALTVLAINWQENRARARDFFASRGLTMTMLFDAGGVYDQYKMNGLPASFFVGRDGLLVTLHYGEITESKARERLAEAGLP
jgi:thiol-disulfide isomerase/thioredoxin